MPITKTAHFLYVAGSQVASKKTLDMYVGRVLKVEHTVETRNWSDTMDYSDYRTTGCTWATVWVGTRGLPRTSPKGGQLPLFLEDESVPEYYAEHVRDLEFHEQFVRVDCTNLFSDRYGYSLSAEVDAEGGDPLMWANWIAFQAYEAAKVEAEAKAEAARKKAYAAEQAKVAAKAAAKAAKDEAAKKAAEELLAKFPPKGTTVTVDGFTGKLFWTGVNKYRGKWSAKAGIKDSRGTVQWVTPDKF